MDAPFHFRKVDQGFTDELTQLLQAGKSAVLVGARDLGKSYLLRQLAKALANDPAMLVIEVEFPREPPLIDTETIGRLISRSVSRAAQHDLTNSSGNAGLLWSVRGLCEHENRSVVLLASNVDCLAHHQAQQFLREMRVLVNARRLAVVLTGEENLRDLVTGPDSEFNCAEQFLIQAYAEDKFCEYMGRRHEFVQVAFADPGAALRALCQATGGNIFLGKATLWVWLELCDCECAPGPSPVTTDCWVSFLKGIPPFEKCDVTVFHHMAQIIGRAPGEWAALQRLLERGTTPISQPGPSELELAGLAVREAGRLRFASPMVERFARSYYDHCRMGDLYAVQGDWKTALGYYEQVPDDRRQRPCGTDDRPHVALVAKALAAVLYTEATRKDDPPPPDGELIEREREKLEQVKELFVRGCQRVLGFPEVTFWTWREEWVPLEGPRPSVEAEAISRKALEQTKREPLGWQEVAADLQPQVALAVLPSIRRDHRDAVVVTSPRPAFGTSRERRKLLRELIDQFAIAYHRSIANYGMALRLKTQREHLDTAAEIVNALGDAVRDPRETLQRAGKALLKLDYSRVMFSLVDAARSAIHGVLDCSRKDETCTLADATHFLLSEPEKDVQPWVVANRKHCPVPDWRVKRNPPIQTSLCDQAGMGAFVVLPMFIASDTKDKSGRAVEEVFGTIHVEREDGLLPSEDDIEDLQNFGRLIAAAVLQSERLNALLQTLERDHDAMVIFDRDEKIRFANPAAARRLEIEPGWHEAQNAFRLKAVHADLQKLVKGVLESGNRIETHDKSNDPENPRRDAIECEPLADWRVPQTLAAGSVARYNRTIAASVHIRDLSGLSRVLNAVQFVANRAVGKELVIQAVVECVPLLRCTRARLYLISPTDPNLLVSTKHHDLEEPYGSRFNEGFYTMPRFDPAHEETWLCLESKKTSVFCWRDDMKLGERFTTEERLEVFAVPTPRFLKEWKKSGTYWVDLPLLAGDRFIGKLTFDIPPDLTPQEREFLDIFAELLGPLIEAPQPMQRWIQEAAEKAIATAAHNIKTKLAALGGLARRYEEASPGNEEIARLNAIHQPAIDGASEIVGRIREMLTKIVPRRSMVDVRTLLTGVVNTAEAAPSHYSPASFSVECPRDLQFSLDQHRIETLLQEMMENSRAMVAPGVELQMRLGAQVETSGGQRKLVISVQDNGPGVPLDKQLKIFEAFYTDRPHGKPGTGLGLNFVWRVAEAHGGGVHVVNNEHSGATFAIQIPESGNFI